MKKSEYSPVEFTLKSAQIDARKRDAFGAKNVFLIIEGRGIYRGLPGGYFQNYEN
jgi:hypothetical protein